MGGKFTPKDHQMQFNETGSALANVELWVQQQNASLQEGPFSPSFGPSGNNKQSRSARNNNAGNQRWLPSPNNWMPNNAPPMVGEFGPDPHMQIPGGYMGESQMPPGRGVMPTPNKDDENLTPEQLTGRREGLARIQHLKRLFFPEKHNEFGNRPLHGMYGPAPPGHPGPDGMMGSLRFPPHHPANMMPPPPGYFNDMGPQPRMSGPHSPVSPSFSMGRDPSGFFFQGAPPPGMNFPQNGPGPHPPDFHPDFMPDGMNEGMFFAPNGPLGGPRMHHGPHDPLAGGPMVPFGPGATRFPGMCKPKRRRNAAGDKSEDIYRHLQPAPSPQQFCSLNLFEGQELTITRQINLAYQDTPDDQSPSQASFNAGANGGQQPKKKKKVDNTNRSNEDSKLSVKSEIPCAPDLFGSASLQSPVPTSNMNSSGAAATPQLPQLNSNNDASANPETSPASSSNNNGNNGTASLESKPIITSLPHCSAPTISKSGSSSGVMSNITSPTLASLAKGVESLSDRIEQDMLQGGLFRTVQMPENDPDVSDEALPASSQVGNRMRPNESSETVGRDNDSNKPEAMAGQNPDFENEKMMMMMKSEASHHMDGPPGVGMDRRPSPGHMFPEMKGHQGMVGNADVRIQARAPNTIQYMPARPPNENNNEAMPHPLPPGFNGQDFNGPMIGPDGNPIFDGGSMGPPGFDGPMVSGDMGHMGPGYGNPMHRNFNGPNMGNFGNGQGGPMPGFDPQGGPMFEGSMPHGMGGPMIPGFNGPPPPGYNGQGHFVNGPSGPMHPGCMPNFDGPCGPMSEFDGSMPGGPQMPGFGNFVPRPMMGGFHGGGGPMGMHNPEMFGGRMPMIHGDMKPNEPMRGKGEGSGKKEKDKKKRSESSKKNAAANQANMNLMNEKNGMNMARAGANKMRPEMVMRMGGGPDFMGMSPMDGKIRHDLMGMGGGAMMEPGMGLRPNMMGGPPDSRIRPGMVRMGDGGAFMGMVDGSMMRIGRDGNNFIMGIGEGPKKVDGPSRPGSGMMMMENAGENGMRPGSRSHSDKGMLVSADGNMRPGSAAMMGLAHEMGAWPGMGPQGENRPFMHGMDGMRPDSRLSAMGIGPEGTPVRPTSASMMGMESDMGLMMQLGDNNPRPGSGMMNDGNMMPGSNSNDMPMKGGPENMSMPMRPGDGNQMRMSGGPDVMMGMPPGMVPEGMMMVGRGGMGRMMVDMDPRMMSEMEGMLCRNGPMNHRMDPGMSGMMEMPNGEMFSGHMMSGPDRRMMMDADQFGNSMTYEMMRSGPGFNPHGGGLISGDPAVGMGR